MVGTSYVIYYSILANTLTLENIAYGRVCSVGGMVVTFSAWQLKFNYNNIAITTATHFFTSF